MAEITEIYKASIFDSKCQTIVNTVNCVGVMGKGVALEYKLRFPEMYNSYRDTCDKKLLRPGMLLLCKNTTPWILNFPTKNHWKYPSKIEYIHSGLQKFVDTYHKRGITSIAFPKLGTTSGKLDWEDVRDLLYRYLLPLENLKVEIYHFDSTSKDSLYDKLHQHTNKLTIDEFVETIGIRRKQALLVYQSLSEGTLSNMANLLSIEGVGDKTIEAIYGFVLRAENKAVTLAEKQMSLF